VEPFGRQQEYIDGILDETRCNDEEVRLQGASPFYVYSTREHAYYGHCALFDTEMKCCLCGLVETLCIDHGEYGITVHPLQFSYHYSHGPISATVLASIDNNF